MSPKELVRAVFITLAVLFVLVLVVTVVLL